jgi:hypothetical protein
VVKNIIYFGTEGEHKSKEKRSKRSKQTERVYSSKIRGKWKKKINKENKSA